MAELGHSNRGKRLRKNFEIFSQFRDAERCRTMSKQFQEQSTQNVGMYKELIVQAHVRSKRGAEKRFPNIEIGLKDPR